jgi:hypothetical protein
VTRDEAVQLLRLLRAAFPTTRIEPDTSELWLAELRRLDPSLGEEAVRSLIAGSRFWPTIAELNEQLEIARVRRRPAEEHRAWEERVAAREREAKVPLPPLREIPAAQELIRRFVDEPAPAGLDDAEPGGCDECGTAGDRYRVGRFALCGRCAQRRQRATAKAEGAWVAWTETTTVGEADREENR